MSEALDYKKRCYETYMSKGHCQGINVKPETYNLFYRIGKKRYGHLLPADKKQNILDVACGMGFFLNLLQREGYENAIGIDLVAEQIEYARQAGIKNIQHIDLFEYLPLHAEGFDMIIANHIIEHFTKPEALKFFDLVYQSLKPGGKVLVRTPNLFSFFGNRGIYNDFTHEMGFSPMSLKQVMEICNFTDIMVSGEEPLTHNLKGVVRVLLWNCLKQVYSTLIKIERGAGSGDKQALGLKKIYTPSMYAVGVKAA